MNVANLILEKNSKNSTENIEKSSKVISSYGGKYDLITSTFYMPPAFLLFKKKNLIFDPVVVDYNAITKNFISFILIDLKKELKNWSLISHELFGILFIKLLIKFNKL